MTLPTTRQTFIDFCLENLGQGVVELEMSEKQKENCCDLALKKFLTGHSEAVEIVHIIHTISGSTLALQAAPSGEIPSKSIVTGQTSGATAKVYKVHASPDQLEVHIESGTFTDGEVVEADNGETATLAVSNAVTLGDTNKGWFDLTSTGLVGLDTVELLQEGDYGINLQIMMKNIGGGLLAGQPWNPHPTLTAYDNISYVLFQQHMQLIDWIYNASRFPVAEYNQYTDRLLISLEWGFSMIGRLMLLKGFKAIDPSEYGNIYNDEWLIEYMTALLNRQLQTNRSHYDGAQLVGGITIKERISEAEARVKELEEQLFEEHNMPVYGWTE